MITGITSYGGGTGARAPSASNNLIFSERELARPSVVCLSVTIVRPTQAVQIFGNISTALGTFWPSVDIH